MEPTPCPSGVPQALREALPEPYVLVLDAVADGLADAAVAALAGVDVAAVPLLVRVATAKMLQAQAALGPAPG